VNILSETVIHISKEISKTYFASEQHKIIHTQTSILIFFRFKRQYYIIFHMLNEVISSYLRIYICFKNFLCVLSTFLCSVLEGHEQEVEDQVFIADGLCSLTNKLPEGELLIFEQYC